MTRAHLFIDTNIILYGYDLDAAEKRRVASEIVEQLFKGPYPPAISVQVLNELYVNLQRRISVRTATQICEAYLDWEIIPLTLELFLNGQICQAKYKISFWDALIVEAAKKAGANKIISEDLAHNQEYYGIRVVNPFKLSAALRSRIFETSG